MASYRVRTYSATREFLLEAVFACPRCGYASPVRVKGSGSASGQGSADMALAMAGGSAQQNAQLNYDLLRCPVCRTRSASGDKREERAVTRTRQAFFVAVPLLLLGLLLY